MTEDILDAGMGELVERAQSERQLNMYAGNRGNGAHSTEVVAVENTQDLAIDLTQEADSLIEAGRRYTKTLSSTAEAALDEIDKLSRELRTELREAERRRNAADSAYVRMAHKVMTTTPRMTAMIQELAAATRASGD